MCKSTNNIPLWLKVKTEYIDENFEEVLEYLKNGNKSDSFYQTTLDLLKKRVEEYLDDLNNRPVYYSESNSYYKDKLIFETRLLSLYLLVGKGEDGITRKRLFMPLLNSLSMLVDSDLCEDLLALMVDNVTHDAEPVLLFNWDDIINFNPSILAYKIINSKVFPKPQPAESTFEHKGCAVIRNKTLGIAALNDDNYKLRKTQLVASMDILGGKMNVLTAKGDKLKQSEENDIEALEKFTKDFIMELGKVCQSKSKGTKKVYEKGDDLYAVITKCGWGNIELQSLDPKYEPISGELDFSDAVLPNYFPTDFYKYLRVGQVIDVQLINFKERKFSLKKGFVRYVVENVINEENHIGETVLAKVTRITEDKRGVKLIDWWSSLGYPVHSPFVEGFSKDDYGYICAVGLGIDDYYGYVYAEIRGSANKSFDVQATKKAMISGFDFPESEEEEKQPMLNKEAIKELLSMMIQYQKTIVLPTERFRVLCFCKIMAALIQSEEYQEYISFIMSYLKQLLLFATSDYIKIEELEIAPALETIDVVRQRRDIVKILKAYGNESDNDVLENIIRDSMDETQAKLARLVLSCNNLSNVVPASTRNIIKREITRNLSLDTEDETNLEEGNGIYLGIEDLHQEFKTSFVYPPDNDMQPNFFIQEKNIFKSLSGFLNTEEGGTLYLGVTDLGYVCGFDNDMKHLKCKQLDSFIRFIQDEAGKFFGNDVLKHFVIKPMYENKVLAIKVEPYEDGIVEFDGKAFIRINNETREMNDRLKQQVKRKKMEVKTNSRT